ncbi:DNA repair protein RecN, partial [Shewanella frigidimarina]
CDEGCVESLLNTSISQGQDLESYDPELGNVVAMLNDALIQVQESSSELERYLDGLELDPEYFAHLELRLSKAMQLARKHQVSGNELYKHHQSLLDELMDLGSDDDKLDDIREQLRASQAAYLQHAKKLSQSRSRYAKELDKQVTQSIHELNMPKGKFTIAVNFNEAVVTPTGCDNIEFLVSTNPG